jgi:hypothetical protein
MKRRARSLASLGALATMALLGGCDSASPKSGLDAWLRTSGQYISGEIPTDDSTTGPKVQLKATTRPFPGATSRTISGLADLTAVAVLVGLQGDSAHWEIPLGPEDGEVVPHLTYSTSASYSPDAPLGPRKLEARAVAADGSLGPVQSLGLNFGLTPPPTGTLIIQLTWDTEADLDLHVRIPDPNPMSKTGYFDVWNRAPLALPPKASGGSYTSDEIKAAGHLLFDSNAQCVIDGARHEEIVFPGAFPPGPYEVRVDTASLCGEPTARWHVAAFTNPNGSPTLIQEAFGQSTERDTVAAHDAASGILALTFSPQ